MMVKRHDASHARGQFSITLVLFICLQLAAVIALLFQRGDNDPYRCDNFLEHGQWSRNPESTGTIFDWNSSGCSKQEYSPELLRQCLSQRRVQFRGDSIARDLFWAVAKKMDGKMALQKQLIATKHANIQLESPLHTIQFIWDPFLNQSERSDAVVNPDPTDVTVVGAGFWHALHLDNGIEQLLEGLSWTLSSARHQSEVENPLSQLVVLPMATPIYERLGVAKAAKINDTVVTEYNTALQTFDAHFAVDIAWAFVGMTCGHPSLLQDDGLHIVPEVASIQATLLLNRICSPLYGQKGFHARPSCCARPRHEKSQTVTIQLLCAICLTCSACSTISRSLSRVSSFPLIRFYHMTTEACAYLTSLSHICAAILYCYVTDRTYIYSTSDKIVDVRLFIMFSAVTTLCGVSTMTRSSNDKVSHTDVYMSRAQSDEWKGWMQFIILLYHFFGMSRVLWIYQIIRCLVGAYLFLTGYGHTLYFIKTNNFSVRRVITVLTRLNLLAGSLAWAMNTTWDFYYFPALSSFWFLIIYVTLYRRKHTTITTTEVLARVSISLAFVVAVIHTSVFNIGLVQLASLIQGRYLIPAEAAREFEFRVKLDLLAPYAGILLGALQTTSGADAFTVNTRRPKIHIPANLVGISLLLSYFCVSHFFSTKQTYNQYHALLSLAPISAYIILRNSSPSLRSHHSRIFAWLGRCSLETFVLQYHIWLAMDTKATLHLSLLDRPGTSGNVALVSFASWRYWIEKAFITAVFLWVSDVVARATNVLVGIIGARRK